MNKIENIINEAIEKVIKERLLNESNWQSGMHDHYNFNNFDNGDTTEQILQKVRNMRSNMLDMSEYGLGVLYVDYNPETNELYAGTATNSGIIPEYSIEYDETFSLDQNLEGLYDEIMSHASFDGLQEESVKHTIKEDIDDEVESYIDFMSFSDILEEMGWYYYDSYDVRSQKDNTTGVRYLVKQDSKNAAPIEEVVKKLQSVAGNPNAVILSRGTHRHAPEITNISIVVLDKPQGEMYGEAFEHSINQLVESISKDIMKEIKG